MHKGLAATGTQSGVPARPQSLSQALNCQDCKCIKPTPNIPVRTLFVSWCLRGKTLSRFQHQSCLLTSRTSQCICGTRSSPEGVNSVRYQTTSGRKWRQAGRSQVEAARELEVQCQQ